MYYTTIEQSKKLLELGLSPESADMEYLFHKKDGIKVSNVPFVKEPDEEPDWCYNTVPCWSVGALMEVLPDEVRDNHYLTLDKEGKEYCCCYEDGNGNSFKHCFSDNPIDACVEMIIKLKENNLI